MIERGYRFPPRFFTKSSIAKVLKSETSGPPVTFILRYSSADDKRAALHRLENWDARQMPFEKEVTKGSEYPFFALTYEMGEVVRAITKIFVNTLSHFSPESIVDPRVKKVILGDSQISPSVIGSCGFVDAMNVSDITSKPSESHSLRLIFNRGWWQCWIAFFFWRPNRCIRHIPGNPPSEVGYVGHCRTH